MQPSNKQQHRTQQLETIRYRDYFPQAKYNRSNNTATGSVHTVHHHQTIIMSETASFVDPVFLARFGLNRFNVLEYFLHPLNPFRTKAVTSNEVLAMQGTSIGMLMQQQQASGGFLSSAAAKGSLPPHQQAEEDYNNALRQNAGEQYELLPPVDPALYAQPSPLYTIRHVLRTNPNTVKVLGIYYVVEGVIYKAPSVRSLMKANITRTLEGLTGACQVMAVCARFQPSTGYTWHFEAAEDDNNNNKKDDTGEEEEEDLDPVALRKLHQRRKRRKIVDHRRPGERTVAEEEGIRASEAMDRILVRLSQSSAVTGK
jgi:MED6 mediator sub complex component